MHTCISNINKSSDVLKLLGIISRRSLFLTICIFSFQLCSYTQPESKNYPVQFSQFIFSYPLVNPSSIGIKSNNEVLLCYQKPVSGFTGVSTYFCNISFVPYKPGPSSQNKSVVGFRFFSDNEGAYISRTRFYGIYAFHTQISNNLYFSGGIDIGGMNFSIKSTPTTEGASAFKMDADAGIWLYNNNFHVGLSVNQIFNSIMKPLDERIVLPTHINITSSVLLLANDFVELRPHLLITFPYYSDFSLRSGLYGLFAHRLIAVVSWNRKINFSAILGVNDLSVYGGKINIALSYSTSVMQTTLGINQLEMSVLYSFGQRQK